MKKRPLSVADLWSIKRVGPPTLSPDGRHACATVTAFDMKTNEGHTELWLFPCDGGKALLSGLSDEEAIRRAVKIIERAVSNGLTEVQVHRFPNQLCTDRGRAINQQEAGWESTLTGVPREIYELWAKYFRSRGYKLKVEILEFPGGIPGDVGMTLQWG